ncbi:MAG: ATP-binding protein [Planctomycetota bacterium]
MSRILVVNPDPAVQLRALKLLNAGCDWEAEPCADAEQALEKLEAEDYELMLLDLGIAVAERHRFLEQLRETRKTRPVLLTGDHGTIDQVVEALQAGAAGFVHVSKLESDLLDHVIRVANAAHRNKCHARLLDCMTSSTTTFAIENDPLLLPTLLVRFQSSVSLFGVCDPSDRTRIGIALEEALSNALYHGNLEVDSDLRAEDLEAYYELAGERRFSEPYASRKIHVTETLTPESATFTIRDEGPGFDTSKLDEEPDENDLEKLSGRGLLMMKSFMDEVVYNDKGNEVTLIKRKKADDDETSLAA